MVIATVLKGYHPNSGQQYSNVPTILLSVEQDSISIFDPMQSYFMIESTVYFDAYRPMLSALKHLGGDGNLPFANVLLGVSRRVPAPSYIIKTEVPNRSFRAPQFLIEPVHLGWDMSAVFPDFEDMHGTKYWNPLLQPAIPELPDNPSLDASQIKAMELALSKSIAVIQGPPGTGKTFVGVLIAKLLLSNKDLRQKKPLLFICQTNHALDQMLEHVHKFEQDIVRLGSRSESTIMQGLNIASARKKLQYGPPSRTNSQYQALNRMNFNMRGLRAALAQRGIVIDRADSLDCKFPNEVLARLRKLLSSLNCGGAIEGLLLKSDDDAAWKDCCAGIKAKNKGYNISVAWVDEFDEWKVLSPSEKLLIMALYSSREKLSIVDYWKVKSYSNRNKKQQEATADWQTVGEEPDRLFSIDGAVDTEVAMDDILAEEDADFDEAEVLRRELDDDYEDDWFKPYMPGMTRSSREEDIANQVIDRSPDVNVLRGILSAADMKLLKAAGNADVWKLHIDDRKRLCLLWARLLNADARLDIDRFTKDYREAAVEEAEYLARCDTKVLQNAAVIGMTTNGAAKYNLMMRSLKPEVVIVEEAAEVLEASIIAALTNSTKHLILIGDHLQLRPQISEYSIATHHGLEVSLFERLVLLGVSHVTLSSQRRMHPDISALITPSIYRHLLNAPNVYEHPRVRGVSERLFFISHDESEDGELLKRTSDIAHDENGKSNAHEATFLVRLLQHLLLNGYSASQIVILAMYKKQVKLMKKLANDAQS